MNRRGLMGGFIVTSVLVCLAIGCWPVEGSADAFSEALEMERPLGGDEQRLIFARDDYPDFPPIDYWTLLLDPQAAAEQFAADDFEPTTHLVAVDPASLAVTPLDDQLSSIWGISGYAMNATDGRWVVWPDYEADLFHVLDLDTHAQSTMFAGMVSQGAWVQAIDDSWMLASISRGSESIIIARNLETGGEISLLANTVSWGATISDGRVAVQYYPDLLPQDDGLVIVNDLDLDSLLTSKVDVIALATGERETVLADLPADSYVEIAGDKIWIYEQDNYSVTRVQTYHLATGQTQTLLELPPAGENETNSIDSIGTIGAILHRSSYPVDSLSSHDVWELITPDGQRKTVLDYEAVYDPFSWSFPVYPYPTIIGKWIVYQDPDTRDWVLYDPIAETRNAVRPFE